MHLLFYSTNPKLRRLYVRINGRHPLKVLVYKLFKYCIIISKLGHKAKKFFALLNYKCRSLSSAALPAIKILIAETCLS